MKGWLSAGPWFSFSSSTRMTFLKAGTEPVGVGVGVGDGDGEAEGRGVGDGLGVGVGVWVTVGVGLGEWVTVGVGSGFGMPPEKPLATKKTDKTGTTDANFLDRVI